MGIELGSVVEVIAEDVHSLKHHVPLGTRGVVTYITDTRKLYPYTVMDLAMEECVGIFKEEEIQAVPH